MKAELAVIHDVLARHRREVLILTVEDCVPSATVAEAGLNYVARLEHSKPLPTMGRLVAGDRRMVVFAEKAGGSPPWFMPAFVYIDDTPLGRDGPIS